MFRVKSENHWQTVARRWSELPAPMGPWPSERKIYQKFTKKCLNGVKSPKILILGATPQMRDIAHAFKYAEVTCVDVDVNMLFAMTGLLKNPRNADKEIWVKSSWVTAPLKENHYNLILGEAVLGNVPFVLWVKFLKHLQDVLKLDGHFVSRVVVTDSGNWHGKGLDEVFSYASDKRLNFIELYFLLFYRIFGSQTRKMSNLDMYKSIKKYYNRKKRRYVVENKYVEGLLNKIAKYLPASPFQWSNSPQAFSERYLKRYFKIIAKDFGNGESQFSAAYHPLYLLKNIK